MPTSHFDDPDMARLKRETDENFRQLRQRIVDLEKLVEVVADNALIAAYVRDPVFATGQLGYLTALAAAVPFAPPPPPP